MINPENRTALTPRELELLNLLQTWLTYNEMAGKMGISINTVKSHSRSLFWKLNVSTRRDAVACGRGRGLIL
jgi:LuxR family transcriptional regulator, maltose regulon positive regulatory protein